MQPSSQKPGVPLHLRENKADTVLFFHTWLPVDPALGKFNIIYVSVRHDQLCTDVDMHSSFLL